MDDMKERLRAAVKLLENGPYVSVKTVRVDYADALARIEELERGSTPWSRAIHDRLEEFQRPRSGIDRSILLPVTAEVAVLTKRLVDMLYTEGVPTPNVYHGDVGSVQIEWVENGWHAEISVAEAYHVDGWITRVGASDEDVEYLRDIRDFGWAVQRLVKCPIPAQKSIESIA